VKAKRVLVKVVRVLLKAVRVVMSKTKGQTFRYRFGNESKTFWYSSRICLVENRLCSARDWDRIRITWGNPQSGCSAKQFLMNCDDVEDSDSSLHW
jgi:hypothetical protein